MSCVGYHRYVKQCAKTVLLRLKLGVLASPLPASSDGCRSSGGSLSCCSGDGSEAIKSLLSDVSLVNKVLRETLNQRNLILVTECLLNG